MRARLNDLITVAYLPKQSFGSARLQFVRRGVCSECEVGRCGQQRYGRSLKLRLQF